MTLTKKTPSSVSSLSVAVIGLGYVGLPLAVEFGKKRPVVGFDINQKRIAELQSGHDHTLEVDAAEFAKAVDRVATVSSERSRAVKLQLDEDRMILSVNAPDSGAAEEELAVAYNDERLEIGFNAKYLLEIASQVDRENAVFLFNSSGDPTLMREGNDTSAVYVVMPMRV